MQLTGLRTGLFHASCQWKLMLYHLVLQLSPNFPMPIEVYPAPIGLKESLLSESSVGNHDSLIQCFPVPYSSPELCESGVMQGSI